MSALSIVRESYLGLSFSFSADTTILSITFFVLSYFLHEEEFWDRFCLLSIPFLDRRN